jgi:hypothetical protein
LTANSTVAPAQREKDAAMRALLVDARWQWAGFAVLGLALLHLKRLGVAPIVGTAFALGAWAAAGWLGRVPWPLAPVALAVVSLVLLAASPWLSHRLPGTRSLPASAFAYPGFVAATGLGWLVLLDLSANGLAANRYLAHYHHGHLWLAMLVFGVVAFWREPIGATLAWTLSFVDGPRLARRGAARRARRGPGVRRDRVRARRRDRDAARAHAPADLGARPVVADRRCRVVLLPARDAAHRAPGAPWRDARLARALPGAARVRRHRPDRGDGRDA